MPLLVPGQVGNATVALSGPVIFTDLCDSKSVLELLPDLGSHSVAKHQPQLVFLLKLILWSGKQVPGHLSYVLSPLQVMENKIRENLWDK